MKILLIYGDKNAGKSTACRSLYFELRGLGATTDYLELINGFGDIEAVLSLNGSKIAIYSAGDNKDYIIAARELAKKWNCDVLIAPVTKGCHYNEVLEDLENEKDFFWFPLEKGADEAEMDRNEERLNEELIKIIREIINF
ncbi:MAG: hypothetical protein HDT08_01450 [Bacteroidales bacterium]|nr:hypothetical protein [Bacteroidales bacterium]